MFVFAEGVPSALRGPSRKSRYSAVCWTGCASRGGGMMAGTPRVDSASGHCRAWYRRLPVASRKGSPLRGPFTSRAPAVKARIISRASRAARSPRTVVVTHVGVGEGEADGEPEGDGDGEPEGDGEGAEHDPPPTSTDTAEVSKQAWPPGIGVVVAAR